MGTHVTALNNNNDGLELIDWLHLCERVTGIAWVGEHENVFKWEASPALLQCPA